MKFVCTKENLAYALDVVSPLAGKHNNLPVLANVFFNATDSGVEVISTNLEVAVKTYLRAKVENPGSFTVPAKTLFDYVRLLTADQAQIELIGNELSIVCGTSNTKIKGMPADEYPVIPEVEESHAYAVNADGFRRALSKTVIAAAKNEIRPELSGVYFGFKTERFDGLIMAATDSYRLAESRVAFAQSGDLDVTCIIPARVVYEVVRLLTLAQGRGGEDLVRLWISGGQFAVRYDDFELTSRLIDGTYPDYAQIIPTEFKTSTIFPCSVMVNKIKAAGIFTTTGVNAVSFDLNASQNSIGVSSTSTQTGEHSSSVDADVIGEENSILLNHRYVLDGLQHIEGDEVRFQMNSADTPCMFTPKEKENADYLYIVMPIRQ